jgi:lipoprotein-anchoring transpeptidase ErfK/SrfK
VRLHRLIVLLGLLALLAGCAMDTRHVLIISTADQRMLILRDNIKIAEYPVSTSKFGIGDAPNSNATPIGLLRIRKKIGTRAPAGAVFKSRRLTGEILPVDAPGRDPIVSRILWLDGLEPQNRNAFRRYIYIHGTPEERNIGVASSYGCIRMRSADVIALYDTVGTGARVLVTAQLFKRSEEIH